MMAAWSSFVRANSVPLWLFFFFDAPSFARFFSLALSLWLPRVILRQSVIKDYYSERARMSNGEEGKRLLQCLRLRSTLIFRSGQAEVQNRKADGLSKRKV